MECSNILEAALKKGNIKASLFKGSRDKVLVTDLQKTLFELGFRKELKWDDYQADGSYGPATAAAVAAFARKNKISSDGAVVTDNLAKLILERHDFLPEMYILWSISESDLRTRKYISRGTTTSITAIQLLLIELGYGDMLGNTKFKADGLFGDKTRAAVIAYASNNDIECDGDLITRPLVNLMLKDINEFYGKRWAELAEQHLPSKGSPLVIFQGSRFRGMPCMADKQFVPSLKKIDAYAEAADVFVYVTSSFRTTTNVRGAIVKPATHSNHLAGHGIDMNVIYNKDKWANSKKLAKFPNVPKPVKEFIQAIIDDPDLRWGGNFSAVDPVHIDDHLNGDMAKWRRRYLAMQIAVQLGTIKPR